MAHAAWDTHALCAQVLYCSITNHPNTQRLKNNKYLLCHAASESQESGSGLAGRPGLRVSWDIASKMLGVGLLSCQDGMGWSHCFQAHSCACQQASRSLHRESGVGGLSTGFLNPTASFCQSE